jgi:hypothetical protein
MMNKWLDKFLHKVPMSHTDIPDTLKERNHEHLTMSGLSGSDPSINGKISDKFLHKVPMSHTDIPDTVKERTHEHLTMSGLSGSNPSIIGKNNSSDSRFLKDMENKGVVLTAEKLGSLFERYEEHGAILEFEGGLARADAERKAFEHILTEGDHYHAQKTKATN